MSWGRSILTPCGTQEMEVLFDVACGDMSQVAKDGYPWFVALDEAEALARAS